MYTQQIYIITKLTFQLVVSSFDFHVTVHRIKFLIIKPTRCTNFSKFFIFGMKLYMFRTVPLSNIRIFPLYTQQWYMSYASADSC